MSSTDTFDLARMISPTDPAAFFAKHWEREPLIVHRDAPHYYDDLLTMDEVDRVITTYQLSFPAITVANANRPVTTKDYTFGNDVIDVARLYQQFALGGSLVMNQLHRFVPALAGLCREVERDAGCPIQTNIYLTPRESQGLKVHYDSHDVFVLQTHGTKHWTLYDTAVALPLRGQSFSEFPAEPGPVSAEFDLKPGDMLYLPRGVMHQAQTTSSESLHITVGVLHTSWAEAIIETVARIALKDPAFRASIPAGHARDGFDRTEAEKTFRGLLQRLHDHADFDGTMDFYAEEMRSNRPSLLRGQLQQVCRLALLTADDRVGVRSTLVFRFRESAEGLTVAFSGRELTLPPHAAEAAKHVLTHPSTAVRDLPGPLDDDGKLVLVRRLIREGLAAAL